MINFTRVTTALALGLALAAATPALAAQRSQHPGHAARAQAVPTEQAVPGEGGMSSARAKALQDCSDTSGKFTQHSWGITQSQLYRACMAGHGEAE
jgi:hypothetical protein